MSCWPESLCVYCGATPGVPAAHLALAEALGRALAAAGVALVYGGGKRGLMGAVADATLAAGGRVIGIIPSFLDRVEITHHGVSELLVVSSMHERKRLMTERAQAFCVLPGGIGTLDEAFEAITWAQLGLHGKPVVFLDPDGFWTPLLEQLRTMERRGYLRVPMGRLFACVRRPEEVLPAARANRPEARPALLERS